MPVSLAKADRSSLRVVFFGPPRSGKSELLFRVSQIAAMDPDTDVVLRPLQPPPRPPAIIHEQFVQLPDSRAPNRSLLLLDCDGSAAAKLLADPDPLAQLRERSQLIDAIRQADALVLVIDAEWKSDQVEQTFLEFQEFLKAFQNGRSQGRTVGGLPVLLTLTKCDILLQSANDPPGEWFARIEERQSELRAQFQDFFDEPEPTLDDDDIDDELLAFGSITLSQHTTAKAVPATEMYRWHRDAMGGFGVGELTTAIVEAAQNYRDRANRSRRRLRWTTTGVLGLLLIMLIGVIGFAALAEPTPLEKLTTRVRSYQSQDMPPSIRLADTHIDFHKHELASFHDSPVYEQLPSELRQFIFMRQAEQAAYAEYRALFRPPQLSPAEVRTRAERDQLSADLEGILQPPPEYEAEWRETEAVRLRAKWVKDLELLAVADSTLHDWYRTLIQRATTLMVEPPSVAWRDQVAELIADSNNPPVKATDSIPDSPEVPIRRGARLAYAAAFRYERTESARLDWEFAARRLTDLRDLCLALGLAPDPTGQKAILDLPEPTADTAASLALPAERMRLLTERFPRAVDGSANWSASVYPDPIRGELARRLRLVADNGVQHVRRLLLAELALSDGRADRPADWTRLAEQMQKRPELAEWGRFLRLLLRWADPTRPDTDPFVDLIAFLKTPQLEAEIKSIELTIPNALRVDRQIPNGPFIINRTPTGGEIETIEFKQQGAGVSVENGVKYTFAVDRPPSRLIFRPGDGLSATLPLRSDSGKSTLTWSSARTASFQIERLANEPAIERQAPGAVPQRTNGVLLQLLPLDQQIRVPELLPAIPGVK